MITAAKILADAVRRAAEIHEKSWTSRKKSVLGGKYAIDLREASNRACAELHCSDFSEPVYYLLAYTWNDVLDWANGRK